MTSTALGAPRAWGDRIVPLRARFEPGSWLGPEDIAWVRQRRPDLERRGVELRLDEALGIGGCVVETPRRLIDASMERRLEMVRESLVEVVQAAPREVEPGEPFDLDGDSGADKVQRWDEVATDYFVTYNTEFNREGDILRH